MRQLYILFLIVSLDMPSMYSDRYPFNAQLALMLLMIIKMPIM